MNDDQKGTRKVPSFKEEIGKGHTDESLYRWSEADMNPSVRAGKKARNSRMTATEVVKSMH